MRLAIQAIVDKPKTHQIRERLEERVDITVAQQVDRLLSDELRREIIRTKSYSPTINKQLVSLRRGDYNSIFGCGIEEKVQVVTKNIGNLMVRTSAGDCVSATSDQGINSMLNNLKLSGEIDCNNIIAPMQIESNCWFNTLFMQYFISDKGRKFSRFLRQLMIQGITVDDYPITPPKLRDAFLLFNAAIEACYNHDESTTDLALALNTNTIVRGIYASIPTEFKKRNPNIIDVGKAGNPLVYYSGIINYLTTTSYLYPPKLELVNNLQKYNEVIKRGVNLTIPHIIVVETVDTIKKGGKNWLLAMNTELPLTFSVRNQAGTDTATYQLDSVAVRDTKKKHFCCVITCNNKEYGFDGASLSRMTPFKWKQLINVDHNWTFPGSTWIKTVGNEVIDAKDNIYWNFKNAYSCYNYYRIK